MMRINTTHESMMPIVMINVIGRMNDEWLISTIETAMMYIITSMTPMRIVMLTNRALLNKVSLYPVALVQRYFRYHIKVFLIMLFISQRGGRPLK